MVLYYANMLSKDEGNYAFGHCCVIPIFVSPNILENRLFFGAILILF